MMKQNLIDAHQKYYAQGRVTIAAKAPQEYLSAVNTLFRSPGIMTVKAKFEFDKFYDGLKKEGIPPKDAENILKSLKLIDDEAYFVPREDHNIRY